MAIAFLWQGFDHEWLRSVLGFRLPHRISKLDSYIEAEPQASFCFAQATGVDGNFMKPVGYYQAIAADGLQVEHGVAALRWTDEISGELPSARSSQRCAVDGDGAVVLRGIRLRTRCDPDKQPAGQPGNSDGMWPYRISVDVRDGRVQVDIERGWTPNKGGIPGVEEKPLTRRLDFEVDIAYSRLVAPAEVLRVICGDDGVCEGQARDSQGGRMLTAISGATSFPVAAAAVTGFELELLPPTERARHQHRGRYIGALGCRARLASYDTNTGAATIEQRARLWVPVTVVRSQARYRVRTALVQLAGAGARATEPLEARGTLCCESSPQAPFFSHWKRCGNAKTGPARAEDRVVLPAPF